MAKHPHERRIALIEEISQVLASEYPSIVIARTSPRILVRGWFPVRLNQATLDRFNLEIVFPNDYPRSVPEVYEVGNRIPRDSDHHVMPEGMFCLFVPDERWRYWGEGKGVSEFLVEIVNDFLLFQLYFEQHGVPPFGERRHGIDGIFDYYGEEIGTNNREYIEQCIRYLSRKEVKGHWKCYCGSGQKLRHCHRDKVCELRNKIPYAIARLTLLRVQIAKLQVKNEEIKRQHIALRYRLLGLSSFRFRRL
jgi:hypothetical protein